MKIRTVGGRFAGGVVRSLRVLLWLPVLLAARPVEFQFTVPPNAAVQNPFVRELAATVITPSGRQLVLPAFYAGGAMFAVRARADEPGVYRIAGAVEYSGGTARAVAAHYASRREVDIRAPDRMPAIGRDPTAPARFRASDGRLFVPVGANVAWSEPPGAGVRYHERAFAAFGQEHLNWMRVWMSHWGQLNLDWLPAALGRSPAPGTLDPRIATNWDALLDLAEQNGVYVQLVLQHHGQYSTEVNPNWQENPWNAANPGGFLKTPTEFFTSPRARALTKQKYRYIVARWGWSPAIFAWELFNEVHWVDAMRNGNEAAVAAWHDEMADYLRSVDVYHHLVTTSTEDLRSPIYAKMDFYQPHLYVADLTAGARRVLIRPPELDRPVFYGEEGDDHLDVSAAVKKSGVAIVPPAWAALMGETRMPAEPWLGWSLLDRDRLGELGAIHRFVRATDFAARPDLQPFSATVESSVRQPLVLHGCQLWRRYTPPDIDVPLDGRRPVDWAAVPRIFGGSERSRREGYPTVANFHFAYATAATLRARIVGLGKGPCGIRFRLDGTVVAEKSWGPADADRPTPEQPTVVAIQISAGSHTLRIENTCAGEWVDVAGLDLGVQTSVLTAVGQRSDRFIAAWVFNREGLYAVGDTPAAAGTLMLEAVPAGTWSATWWDTLKGAPLGPAQTIAHPGGTLRLPTPPIARHAAVVLTR